MRIIAKGVALFALACLASCSSDDVITEAPAPIPEEVVENFLLLNGEEPMSIDPKNNFILFNAPYALEDESNSVESMTLETIASKNVSLAIDGEPIDDPVTVDLSRPIEVSVTDEAGESRSWVVALCYGNLPTIYVNTNDAAPIVSKEEYLKNTEVFVFNSSNDSRYEGAKIKGRGNSSWTLDKKPYTLKLDKKDEFAGMAKHKTFAFVANHSDKTLLRNSLSYEMARDIYDNMSWTPHTLSVHLVLNGSYDGVYTLTETVKIDANRVNIRSIEDCPSIEEADNYGFIIEANQLLDESLNITTLHGNKFTLKDPDGADLSDELREYISHKVEWDEYILYGNVPAEDARNLARRFDIDSFVDWYLVNEIAKNQDSRFGNSCFFYYDPADKRWHAGPVWDFDCAYGNINYGGTDTPEGFHVNTARWPQQFFTYPEFVDRVKTRWNEKKGALRTFFAVKVVADASTFEPDAIMNFNRWDILGKYVWPNATGFESRLTYRSEVDYLLDWVNRRIDWLDQAINAL